MKVAQNDETNPDTQSVRPPHVPSIVNLQHFTSGSFVRKRETAGILSRMFPPFAGTTYCRVRTRLALPVVLLCTCLLCIYCFSPPLLSGRPRDDADAPVVDYITDDPSLSCQSNQASPPFDHQISPTLLYTACIRVV